MSWPRPPPLQWWRTKHRSPLATISQPPDDTQTPDEMQIPDDTPTTQQPASPPTVPDEPGPSSESVEEAAEASDGISVLKRIRPAYANSTVPPVSWILAVLILITALLALVHLLRRQRRRAADNTRSTTPPPTHSMVTSVPSAGATFAALESLGEAMLVAGYPVVSVQAALEDVARVNGHPAAEVVVFPTALIISSRSDGRLHTGALSTGGGASFLLHQPWSPLPSAYSQVLPSPLVCTHRPRSTPGHDPRRAPTHIYSVDVLCFDRSSLDRRSARPRRIPQCRGHHPSD